MHTNSSPTCWLTCLLCPVPCRGDPLPGCAWLPTLFLGPEQLQKTLGILVFVPYSAPKHPLNFRGVFHLSRCRCSVVSLALMQVFAQGHWRSDGACTCTSIFWVFKPQAQPCHTNLELSPALLLPKFPPGDTHSMPMGLVALGSPSIATAESTQSTLKQGRF